MFSEESLRSKFEKKTVKQTAPNGENISDDACAAGVMQLVPRVMNSRLQYNPEFPTFIR